VDSASHMTGRPVGRLYGQSANCTASVETIQLNCFYFLSHAVASNLPQPFCRLYGHSTDWPTSL
jgi:hypothetical protein